MLVVFCVMLPLECNFFSNNMHIMYVYVIYKVFSFGINCHLRGMISFIWLLALYRYIY